MHTPDQFERSALEALAAGYHDKEILILAETPEVETAVVQVAGKAGLRLTLF